jgi:hypothetical protein
LERARASGLSSFPPLARHAGNLQTAPMLGTALLASIALMDGVGVDIDTGKWRST